MNYLIIFILVCIVIIINSNIIEDFGGSYALHQLFILPNNFMNISTRNTRNMSYDIRGDVYIPKREFIWNNSSLDPIHNKGINI